MPLTSAQQALRQFALDPTDPRATAWRHHLPDSGRFGGDGPTFQTLDTLAYADEELGIHGGWIEPLFGSPVNHGNSVPVPQNADQAHGMVNLGMQWLASYAPERLIKVPQEIVTEVAGLGSPADPLQALADQAQALDIGYGEGACAKCGASPAVQIEPEFCIDPDGELCLDWFLAGARLSVSIGGVGRVSWAVLDGDKKACGSRLFENERGSPAVQVEQERPIPPRVTQEMVDQQNSILDQLEKSSESMAALAVKYGIDGAFAQRAEPASQRDAESAAERDVRESRELWEMALAQAAFYVNDHCANGEYHAEAIMSMPLPKITATKK